MESRDFNVARQWGKNGRRRVIERFTRDIIGKKTLSMYGDAITCLN
ncbi:MAG: hypothetical protein M8353_02310 [ANME-2 cluster archaeon]|nr:hypothetical protein [ANME-2 cluster archaeon]